MWGWMVPLAFGVGIFVWTIYDTKQADRPINRAKIPFDQYE